MTILLNLSNSRLNEVEIMREADRQSRRLGQIAIDASNVSWKHDDLVREYRHSYGARKAALLAAIAALNRSYGDAPHGASSFKLISTGR